MSIYRPSKLKEFLQEIDTRPKKCLSQNFLIDGNIIRKIVAKTSITDQDFVIEIGPGPGALTEEILKTGASLVTIEMDTFFAKALHRFSGEFPKLCIIQSDVLDIDFTALISKYCPTGKKAKILSNLPYHLTTPILAKLLPLHPHISTLTFMMQHEVALRCTANHGSKDYSSLSLFAAFYSKAEYLFKVNASCFYPKPKVASAIVQFNLHEDPINLDQNTFFQLVRAAFGKRRKMLRASLKELYAPSDVEKALMKIGIREDARAENLSLENFINLYQVLKI